MAEEIDLGRLVAEIALDNQSLQDSAEEAIETIQEIGETAESTRPEVDISVNGADEATVQVRNYENALNDSTNTTKEQEKANDELSGGFTILKGAIADLAANALQAAIDKFGELMVSGKQALNAIQAQTGMTNAEMSKFKDEMYDLYSQNYGDSLEDVANKMSLVKQSIDETDPENIKEITKNAIAMSDTFDMDFSETVRGVNALMTNMGITADEAFDYIAKGAQNGLNITEELGDNLSEYTQLWSQAGFSAEEMFSVLQNGIDSGAYNLDKVNDLVKEISISVIDGRVEDSLDSFSEKTAEVFYQFKQGQATQKDVFNSIIDDMNTTSGLAEKLLTASDTWSALGEDNAMSVIQALNNVNDTYADVSGTMQSINDIKYDDVGNQLATLGRKFETDLIQPIVEGVTPALENILNWATENLPLVAAAFTSITTAVLGYKAAVNMDNVLNTVKNSFSGLITKIKGSAVASVEDTVAKTGEKAATEGAKVAQDGLNTSMKANPILLVISAVASLAIGLATYSAAAQSAADDTGKYIDAVNDAKKTADESIAKTDAKIDVIKKLGEQYETLRTQTNRTAQEQETLDSVAEQLAGQLGTTTDKIKDQSGEYISLNSQIEDTVEKMKEQAEMNAKMSVLETAYEEKYKAQKELNDAMAEYNSFIAENQELYERYSKGQTTIWEQGKVNELKSYSDKVIECKNAVDDCQKSIDEYGKAFDVSAEKTNKDTQAKENNGKSTSSGTSTNNNYAKSMKGVSDSAVETTKSLEGLKNQLTEQNKELLDNQEAIRRLKNDLKEVERNAGSAEKDSATALYASKRLENLKNQISQLQTQQTEIRESIKDTKEEISKYSDGVVEAFNNMIQAQQDLQTVSDEVATSNKINLSTLGSLQKRYPELLDLISEYINGRKSETDIINAMKGIYDNDVDNYNNATKAKMLASENFYHTLLDNNAKLVNDYKDKYEIDLKNYKSVQEAKVAIQAQAEEQKRREVAKTVRQTADTYIGSGSSELARIGYEMKKSIDDGTYNSWEIQQAGQKAVEEFNKSIDKYYKNTYSVYAGVAVKGVDKNKKTGSNSDKSTTYTTRSSDGIVGTGSTYAEANLDWLSKQKNLGKISTEYEINYLKKLKQYRQNTADDIYNIEYQLYQAEQKLKDKNADSLNTLGDAVVNALKNRYAQQKELEEKRIDESIESWKKWENETCEAIQGQIDALDELKNAHDEENQRQEYENKRQALELQARYEKDDYNRKQIQKEIAALDKDENERLFNLQIEQQKKALQEQMDNVKEISQNNQDSLGEKKDAIAEKYDKLTSDFALKAEAQKTILKSSQKDLIQLINSYAPEYEMAGMSLGESLYNGFKSKTGNISGYVGTITSGVDKATALEKKQSASNAESFWKSENSYYNSLLSTAANKSSEVKQTQSMLDKLAARVDSLLNSISSTATAYKNQMAITANAAADRYYSTQQYYTNSTQSKVSSPTNIYMTVNFNDKVDSPIEVKRQMEYVSQQLAKQISN